MARIDGWENTIWSWVLEEDPHERWWMPAASCKDVEDTTPWFTAGKPNKQVISICCECPVRKACRDYAIKHRFDNGIWGGLTKKQRKIFKNTGLDPLWHVDLDGCLDRS